MKRIIFASTNKSSWGGSEYLWYKSAVRMSESGIKVGVSIPKWKSLPDEIKILSKKKIDLDFNTNVSRIKKIYNRIAPREVQLSYSDDGYKFIRDYNPELVIINQGGNTGGIDLMEFCIRHKLKFVTISQAANEAKWPSDTLSARLSEAYPKALMNYFVSKSNKNLTETEIGQDIKNAKVIFNPFNVRYDNEIEYPEVGDFFLIANVARHEFFAKGLDILFTVLNEKKWKERNLYVNMYGKGENTVSLKKLKDYFGLDKVKIKGHIDPSNIWKENHALILTSRYEGLPLALVEAMLCGRTAVVTNVSGNPEVIKDNETGFIACAATAEMVDEAFERAWEKRNEWKEIGMKAKKYIRSVIPEDPVKYFCDELTALRI